MELKEPKDYVKEALSIMEDELLCARNVRDWIKFQEEVLVKAQDANSVSETYPIIRDALKALNDPHNDRPCRSSPAAVFAHEEPGMRATRSRKTETKARRMASSVHLSASSAESNGRMSLRNCGAVSFAIIRCSALARLTAMPPLPR